MNKTQTNWAQKSNGNRHILYTNEVTDEIRSAWFKPYFWQNNKSIVGESQGRNTTYFIDHTQQDGSVLNMVLRRYYRGGLIGKIINNTFLYHGLRSTRGAAEFLLLLQMTKLGLPVPKPIAVRVRKTFGFWCRNQILIERINGAQDMFQLLSMEAASDVLWQDVGKVIKQFHQHGVYHSDLNIHNILLDAENKVYLIDFDKCDIRQPDSSWQQKNLDRLKRSLTKELGLNPEFHFEENDWNNLMIGYNK